MNFLGLCIVDLNPDTGVCKVVVGEVRLHVSKATEDDAANIKNILVAINDGIVRLVASSTQTIIQAQLLYARVEMDTTNRPTTISPTVSISPTLNPSIEPTPSSNLTLLTFNPLLSTLTINA